MLCKGRGVWLYMLYKNSAIILLTVDNFSSVKNYQILAISNRGGGGGGGGRGGGTMRPRQFLKFNF